MRCSSCWMRLLLCYPGSLTPAWRLSTIHLLHTTYWSCWRVSHLNIHITSAQQISALCNNISSLIVPSSYVSLAIDAWFPERGVCAGASNQASANTSQTHLRDSQSFHATRAGGHGSHCFSQWNGIEQFPVELWTEACSLHVYTRPLLAICEEEASHTQSKRDHKIDFYLQPDRQRFVAVHLFSSWSWWWNKLTPVVYCVCFEHLVSLQVGVSCQRWRWVSPARRGSLFTTYAL